MYNYDYDKELWREMTLHEQYEFDDYDSSEYRLELPDNNYSIAAVKIQLISYTGNITGEKLGTSNGKNQTFKLKKLINDGNITVYSNGAILPASRYFIHDDTQYITVTETAGRNITASYSWISETPKVYQFAAVLSQ